MHAIAVTGASGFIVADPASTVELGWRASTTLDQGMARTRVWARAAGLLDR